jgi:hypothetical protein
MIVGFLLGDFKGSTKPSTVRCFLRLRAIPSDLGTVAIKKKNIRAEQIVKIKN